ncbi:MAG: ELWxxDGT repeat protein [Roseiflexaceae bacterium]
MRPMLCTHMGHPLVRGLRLLMVALLGLLLALPARADGPAFLVKNINTTPDPSPSSDPQDLEAIGNTVYFSALSKGYRGLWKSDGTAAGTVLVKEISPTELTNVNGMLFFVATGRELWKSDGTATGTAIVKDINGPINDGSLSWQKTNFKGQLFFVADDGIHGNELWKSDGTTAGTIPASTLLNVDAPGPIVGMNGSFFFGGSSGQTHGLWKSEGTPNSTVLLKEMNFIFDLASVNGTLFFVGPAATYGSELWASDGTAAGTRLVKDIVPGGDHSDPNSLTNAHGRLFFTANDRVHGRELWTSDGTAAGTTLVKNIRPDTRTPVDITPDPVILGAVGRTLFFTISDGIHGDELWKSDGTAAGTTLVQDIAPGRASSTPVGMAIAGSQLFFSADDQSNGAELWALRGDIDTFVQAPTLAGAPPNSPAAVPIQYGNIGIASASALTLTATLDPALTYVGDTSGISPTISGQTLTWRISDASVVQGRGFTLSVRTPNAAYGTRYPVALTLAVAGQEAYPADNSATVQVMIARQAYLPLTRR